MDLTLRQALDLQTHERLLQIAASWSLEFRGSPTRKLLVEQIAANMLDPKRLAAVLNGLQSSASEGVGALVKARSVSRSEFEQRFGDIGTGLRPRYAQHGLLTPAATLHLMGLAYLSRTQALPSTGNQQEIVWTPTDLAAASAAALTGFQQSQRALSTITPPATCYDAGFGVTATVAYALAYMLEQGYQLTKAGDVHKGYLAKFTEHVYGKGAKDARVFEGPPPLWLHPFLSIASLIASDPRQQVRLTLQGLQYVKDSPADQISVLYHTWKKFQVTYHAVDSAPGDGAGYYYQEWIPAYGTKVRNQLLLSLGKLHVEDWHRLDHPSMLALAKTDPDGTISPLKYRYMSFGRARGADVIPTFTVANATAIVIGPLAWLGIVKLDHKPDGKEPVTAFALTPLGEWVLSEHRTQRPPASNAPIVVQPSFDVLLPREAAFQAVLDIEQICTLSRRDVASTYTLTKQSVGGALARGMSGDAIVAALERASQRPLPANVAHTVKDWTATYGRIRVMRRTFLITDSTSLMAELKTARKLQGMIEDNVEERVAIVAERQGSTLVKRLKELGHLPLADELLDDLASSGSWRPEYMPNSAMFSSEDVRKLFAALEIASLFVDSDDSLSAKLESLQTRMYQLATDREKQQMTDDADAISLRYTDDQAWGEAPQAHATEEPISRNSGQKPISITALEAARKRKSPAGHER